MPKLLIVDDSVSVRKALERILVQQELEVSAADSAENALQLLTQQQPDLVIADVVMPGMDGFELTQVLKSDEKYKHMPVILISGIVNDSVKEQAKDVGAIDVIKKPFNPKDLIPTIYSALENAAADSSEESTPAPAAMDIPEDETFSDLKAQLGPFLTKEDIESVMLVNAQGDCLMSLGREIEDPATFAGYFKFFTSAASILGDKLAANDLASVLLEYKNKALLMQRVDGDVSIILVLKDMTVLSVARFLLKKQLPAVQKALYADS